MNGALHLPVGIPGSGKSTFCAQLAAEFGYNRIELDGVRRHIIDNKSADWQKKHVVSAGFAPVIENEVWEYAYDALEYQLLWSETVVWDATNVKPDNRRTVKSYADKYEAPITVYMIDTPWEVCVARNAARQRVVPDDVMLRMKEWWDRNCTEEHLRREGFTNIIHITDTQSISEQLRI